MNTNRAADDVVFNLNLALSVMKPLIPSYVIEGINTLKEEKMKNAIAKSFLIDGLVQDARLEATYQEALLKFPRDIEVEIPEEVEANEDLGPIDTADDEVASDSPLDNMRSLVALEMFAENMGDAAGDLSESDASASDSESGSDSESKAPQIRPKRAKQPSKLTGSIKKSKYSR